MECIILGVEIGGTKLQLALGTTSGAILVASKGSVDKEAGGEGIRHWLLRSIPKFVDTSQYQWGQIKAIGVGFGGPINSNSGRILESIQIEGWEDFPLREWFEEQFDIPTAVENDSNAATWGEFKRGFGQGCQHFFYTNMGSGVGGGFVLDGHLFNGQGFGAGEFGHTYVPDWTTTQHDQAKKVEDLCSGWAIERRLRQPGYVPGTSMLYQELNGEMRSVTPKQLGEAAQKGDAFSLNEIDRIANAMGLGLANVLCLTGIERIAIGGGVSNLGAILIDPIKKYTKKYAFVINKGRYEISRCQLGDEIVLVGSILIAKGRFGIS